MSQSKNSTPEAATTDWYIKVNVSLAESNCPFINHAIPTSKRHQCIARHALLLYRL